MTHTRSTSTQLGIFLFAQLVFFLDFQTIILYFSTFSETFQVSYIYMGLLISAYSIFTLFSPIFGSLSDQYGRKRFLNLGLVVFALSSVIMVVAVDWTQVLLARAFSGLANAIFFPAFLAHLGDTFSYEQRSRAMGFVRLAWPITFIFGSPLIGYSIEHLNWRFPFVMMAIFTLITGLIINLLDSTSESKNQTVTTDTSLELFKKVLSNRRVVSGLVMMLLAVGAIQGIFAFWPAWMETQFQLGESEISIVYSFMGVGTLFGTLLATWIGDDFGPKGCAVSGLVSAAGCMFMLSHFSFNPIFVIFWLLLLGTSFDFSVTVRPVLLTQLAPDAKGTAISLSRALNAGATAVSTAFCGIIWTNFGYPMIGLIFGCTALIGALIGFFFIKIPLASKKIRITDFD